MTCVPRRLPSRAYSSKPPRSSEATSRPCIPSLYVEPPAPGRAPAADPMPSPGHPRPSVSQRVTPCIAAEREDPCRLQGPDGELPDRREQPGGRARREGHQPGPQSLPVAAGRVHPRAHQERLRASQGGCYHSGRGRVPAPGHCWGRGVPRGPHTELAFVLPHSRAKLRRRSGSRSVL